MNVKVAVGSLVIATMLMFSSLTFAEKGPYAIVGGGIVSHDTPTNMSSDQEKTAWNVGVGYKFTDFLSFEVDYRNMGNVNSVGTANVVTGVDKHGKPVVEQSDVSAFANFKGVGTSVVLSLPTATLQPYVRIGGLFDLSSSHSSYVVDNVEVMGSNHDARGVAQLYGFGVSYKLLALEYTAVKGARSWDSSVDLDTTTLSLKILF